MPPQGKSLWSWGTRPPPPPPPRRPPPPPPRLPPLPPPPPPPRPYPPPPPKPPPPPPPRLVLGRASLTLSAREPNCVPLTALIAFSASSSLAISTKPKPRACPLLR